MVLFCERFRKEMQSRREEDHGRRASMECRLRDPKIERGISPYSMPSREVMKRSPRPRRCLSPPGRVVGGGDVRVEREHFRSQSPPFGRMNMRRGNYDGGFHSRDELRRKYEFCDIVDYEDEFGPGLDHSSFRGNADRDGVLGDARDHLLSGKPRVSERESMYRREYRLEAEREYTLRHAEDAGKSSLSSRNLETAGFNKESIQYPDPFLLEKLVALETYRKGEEHTTQSRDFSFSKGSASLSKDTSESKEFAGTFSRSSRENMMGSYQDDLSLPIEIHPSSSGQPVEQYSFAEVHQRHSLGTRRDSEAKHNDLLHYNRAAISPSVVEGWERDHLYSRSGFGKKDDYSYPSEGLRERRSSDDVDYYQRDITSSNVIEPNRPHTTNADYPQRRPRSSKSWDKPSLQDQSFSKYVYPDRSLAAVDEKVRLHIDPESANFEFDDGVFREAKVSLLNISPNDGLSRRRITRGSESDAFFMSGTESMRISSDNQYQMEMQEYELRRKAIYSDELDIYDPLRRSLKRKYDIDEDLSRHRTRDTLSVNTYNLNSSKYRNERDDVWNHHDAMDLLPSKSLKYNQNKYRRAGRKVDFVEHGEDLISDDRWFYHDPMDYKQEYSSKPFKPGIRILKGQPRHGLLDSYSSQTSNKRHSLTKNKEPDEPAYETQKSKNWVSSSESGPSEESKEFKELVQAFFLSFSKMLNGSVGTRKRYKEQGRAGSLFCIVCGKRSVFFVLKMLFGNCNGEINLF